MKEIEDECFETLGNYRKPQDNNLIKCGTSPRAVLVSVRKYTLKVDLDYGGVEV
jgi:hypothetical protein